MGNSTFYRIFKRILKKAGLDKAGITAHSLRHAYATMLLHSDGAAKQAAAEALHDLVRQD